MALADVPSSSRAAASDRARPAEVQAWLFAVAALVVLMVMVGGATRLTDSGLSITEWQPILGAIPPLTDADWQDAFAKYRQIPEYREINRGMSLDAFKVIFWWEWAHRFLGRIIGVAFAVPLVLFWVSGRLPKGLGLPLVGLLGLGGLQGAIGWYMVQSGLTEGVDVSPYRLALHLTLALVILGLLVWVALGLAPARSGPILLRTATPAQRRTAWLLVGLLYVQVVAGAFVAGHKAGLTYNTWPLMDGQLIPGGLLTLSPWWMNAVENITAIQFTHRILAYAIVALGLWHAVSVWRTADDARQEWTALLLGAGLLGQAALGVATLLSVDDAKIPVVLGIAHQAGAALLIVVAVWHAHTMTRRG
jgi:cytochrome c oxidase assembly protein subunit 15